MMVIHALNENHWIKYEKLEIEKLVFHKVSIDIDQNKDLFRLYDEFNIILTEKIRHSCFKRKNEYFIGRLAAQYALKSLGYPGFATFNIAKGEHGEPLWPEGFSGSISHSMYCSQKGMAIACLHTDPKKIGVDIEIKNNHTIFLESQDISKQFLNPHENKKISEICVINKLIYLIVFSAKESIIKAVYSHTATLLSFRSIHCVNININENSLIFYVPIRHTDQRIKVNYLLLEDAIMTYCFV